MSNGEKIQRWQAMTVANTMMARLAGVCDRVEIAGSLRRCKEMVGDIEIVCIPRLQADLLGGESYLWGEVREALACYKMIKGGDHYQQYDLELCKADVFVTTREQGHLGG
jgi:DNA polymerase/3'-5' exonuclease PolX